MKHNDPWILRPRPILEPRLRLFCLPFAGGGASFFRTWAELLPADVELCPVQLPGREARLREPLHRDLRALVPVLAEALQPALDRPFAVFGHSMGAMIGFELLHQLKRVHGREASHLFVSARRAPDLPATRAPYYDLPTPRLMLELRRMNGTPAVILNDPDMMDFLLPIIRADFCMLETYAYAPLEPLRVPITAFGGQYDPEVEEKELAAWSAHSRGAFSLQMFAGDHFFLNAFRPQLLRTISQALSGA